jgi:hypothetical protein
MKRSHTVVLTAFVAAAAVHGADAQTPTKPADAIDCREARKAAKRDGTPVPQDCIVSSHGVAHGGFGAFGHLHVATS